MRPPMVLAFLATVAGAFPANGQPPTTPYEVDKYTLHLWHLDERAAPFADAVESGQPLQGLLFNAEAGLPSMKGMGHGVSFNFAEGKGGSFKGAILAAAPALNNGGYDNVPDSFLYTGPDGAFTLEALVRFSVLPSQMPGTAGGVITMDGDANHRIFTFRVERSGFLAFVPLGALGHGGNGGGALAAIPTTGPHAVNTTDWFHVAVAYDGTEGTANNLTLYWTRLDEPRVHAHSIGGGTLVEDLTGVSDFALGNEARGASGQEPFPGVIDEVRISSVARDRTDFLFVPPALRHSPDSPDTSETKPEPLRIQMSPLIADGVPAAIGGNGKISLAPGTHRLDFEFGVDPKGNHSSVRYRCRLRGLEEQWMETGRGMSLTCEVLDEKGNVVSLVRRPILGTSSGWQTGVEDSEFRAWREPLFVPETAKTVRVTLSSGADDTAGVCVIDDLDLIRALPDGKEEPLWPNSGFDRGERVKVPQGVPSNWVRSGSAPTIARMVLLDENPALALVDGDQAASGSWSFTRPLAKVAKGGETLVLRGKEMYNVVGGNRQRAIFTNVPPGDYAFEVVAVAANALAGGTHAEIPFSIETPLTSRPWFWAAVASCVVASLAVGFIAVVRHKAARKLHKLRLQNALSRDRARIARDMHDDLGTRVTLLNMNASLARRDLHKSPDAAERHLGNLSESARTLVTAMDDLVWAIDPKNDTLDHLCTHIGRLVQEIFRDSEVHCAVNIPYQIQDRDLPPDFRHHVSLAVKESLHNILRHAGPCEASLALEIDSDELFITIRDRGRGFDTSSPEAGNGLENLKHRLSEAGGTCSVTSVPGEGSVVTMRCPLPPTTGKKLD